MPCGDKKVFRISESASVKPKAKPVIPIVDFHCNVCGHTRRGKTKQQHKCPGPQPITYQLTRAAICNACEWNDNGICGALKAQHPDKPCAIDVGLSNPAWKCPVNKWHRCQWKCDRCGSVSFSDYGLKKCPRCFPAKPDAVVVHPRAVAPIRLRPSSKFAVLTVAVGTAANELSRLTIPRLQSYAERCGADFHAIYDDQWPEYRIGNKFRLGAYTPFYQRLLFVDIDVFVRSNAPDLFQTLQQGSIYMHHDGPHLATDDWLRADEIRLSQEQGVQTSLRCYNSGVVLWDRRHADLWKPPPNAFLGTHTAEQAVVEWNAQHYGIRELPTEFNTQWWFSDFKERVAGAQFIHLANCPQRERIAWLHRLSWEDRQCSQESCSQSS